MELTTPVGEATASELDEIDGIDGIDEIDGMEYPVVTFWYLTSVLVLLARRVDVRL